MFVKLHLWKSDCIYCENVRSTDSIRVYSSDSCNADLYGEIEFRDPGAESVVLVGLAKYRPKVVCGFRAKITLGGAKIDDDCVIVEVDRQY